MLLCMLLFENTLLIEQKAHPLRTHFQSTRYRRRIEEIRGGIRETDFRVPRRGVVRRPIFRFLRQNYRIMLYANVTFVCLKKINICVVS